jgi:hypothetical protein
VWVWVGGGGSVFSRGGRGALAAVKPKQVVQQSAECRALHEVVAPGVPEGGLMWWWWWWWWCVCVCVCLKGRGEV